MRTFDCICGNEPDHRTSEFFGLDSYIQCWHCGRKSGTWSRYETAVEDWNRYMSSITPEAIAKRRVERVIALTNSITRWTKECWYLESKSYKSDFFTYMNNRRIAKLKAKIAGAENTLKQERENTCELGN